MIYVLKMDNPKSPEDTGTPTRVRLIGPFLSEKLAGSWGRSRQSNPHDNPCWQVVDLDAPTVPIEAP